MTESHEAIFSKWEACERLAKDQSTTSGERNSARKQAERLKLKLDELAKQQSINLSYESYVQRGRQAVKTAHGSQWVLGALFHNIVIEYGKRRLQQFADDIGAAYSTLRNCRATWEAWPDVHGRPKNFSVAEALNYRPDRYKIMCCVSRPRGCAGDRGRQAVSPGLRRSATIQPGNQRQASRARRSSRR